MKLATIVIVLAISCAALGDFRPCKVCLAPNTEYRICGDECPRTCENLEPKKPCIQVCRPGCYCKKGFVWDNKSERCVLPCDCPKPTPKPPCGCFKKPVPCGCAKKPCGCPEKPCTCGKTCYCNKGYSRCYK